MPDVVYITPGVTAATSSVTPETTSAKAMVPKGSKNVFYQQDRYVSIEADHYTKAANGNGITWQVLPDHGRTGSAITTMPVTAAEQPVGNNSPYLEYTIYFNEKMDSVKLQAYFSPTLNFHNDEGLKYAVSFDDETPQTVSINKDDNNQRLWNEWAATNIIIKTTKHHIASPGKHVLKFWRVSPAVVLQKLVVDAGGAKQSYLGPPETK